MEYKILLVGFSGVGKTSFIQRHKTGQFTDQGSNTNSLVFTTNHGIVKLHITESTGFPSNLNYDGYIIMFDLKNLDSLKILDQIPSISAPKVLIGNKQDEMCNKKIDRRGYFY